MTTSTRRIAAAIDDHLDHLDVGPSGLPGVIAGGHHCPRNTVCRSAG